MSATIMNSATHVTHTFAFLSRDRKRRHHTPSPRQRSCALHALQQLKRLGIFVSGGGSNFRAIHESCVSGRIKGHVVVRSIALCSQGLEGQFHAQPAPHWLTTAPCQVVVTDVPTCGGAEYAMCHGIDVLTFPAKGASAHSSNATPMKSADDLTAILSNEYKLDYILLAGYLKLVPPTVVQAFSRRMLNIHPGLLPAFGGKGMYGMNVHKAVVSSGSRYSGPTVHFVDEHYDTGPIVAQRAVPCYADDTAKALAERVLKQEHDLYPQVVAALCDDRVVWREDGIPYIWAAM